MYYRVMKILMAVMIGDLGSAGPFRRKLASIAMDFLPGQLTCRKFHGFISDYAEDRLHPSMRRRFEFHLSVCSMCSSHLAAYMKTIDLSKAALTEENADEPVEAPQDLVNAILASIVLSENDTHDDNADGEGPNGKTQP